VETAANLSRDALPSQRIAGGLPGPRQPPFGVGIRPIHRVMSSPCLSAGGLRFLDHPVPLGSRAFLAVGLLMGCGGERTPVPSSDPKRGFHVPRQRGATGEGALSTPGLSVSAWTPSRSSVRGSATTRSPIIAVAAIGNGNLIITGPRRGFTCVRPSSLSLARLAWMAQVRLGHDPTLRLPAGVGNHLDTGGADPSAIRWCGFVSHETILSIPRREPSG